MYCSEICGVAGVSYQWTRKDNQKTVSVASLSKEQYAWMKEAIKNLRQVQAALKRMEQISRMVLFQTVSEPSRRKALTKRVLGLI